MHERDQRAISREILGHAAAVHAARRFRQRLHKTFFVYVLTIQKPRRRCNGSGQADLSRSQEACNGQFMLWPRRRTGDVPHRAGLPARAGEHVVGAGASTGLVWR
jgi:hypothetical protein